MLLLWATYVGVLAVGGWLGSRDADRAASTAYARGYAAARDSVLAINAHVRSGLDLTEPVAFHLRGWKRAHQDTVLYVNGTDSLWVLR